MSGERPKPRIGRRARIVLCVVAILWIAVAVIAIPAIIRDVRMDGYRQRDVEQLKEFGGAMLAYADDNTGGLPLDLAAFAEHEKGIPSGPAYICPSRPPRELTVKDLEDGKVDYAYVGWGLRLRHGEWSSRDETGRIESEDWHKRNPGAETAVVMHTREGLLGNRVNFLFLDGHVESVDCDDARAIAAQRNWQLRPERITLEPGDEIIECEAVIVRTSNLGLRFHPPGPGSSHGTTMFLIQSPQEFAGIELTVHVPTFRHNAKTGLKVIGKRFRFKVQRKYFGPPIDKEGRHRHNTLTEGRIMLNGGMTPIKQSGVDSK